MTRWLVALALLVVIGGYAEARAAGVPNGGLQVAYRQSEAGTLSDSVHHLSFWCSDGSCCSLTTLSLNQCGFGAFYPKVERSSTAGGDLRVIVVAPGVLFAEERGVATFKYEFRYTTREDAALSRTVGLILLDGVPE